MPISICDRLHIVNMTHSNKRIVLLFDELWLQDVWLPSFFSLSLLLPSVIGSSSLFGFECVASLKKPSWDGGSSKPTMPLGLLACYINTPMLQL